MSSRYPHIFLVILLVSILSGCHTSPTSPAKEAQHQVKEPPVQLVGTGKVGTIIPATSALAIQQKNGQIIYQQNANQQLPIASLTKLVTYVTIRRLIKTKKLSWQHTVKINAALSNFSQNRNYSNVFLKSGDSYTVRQLVNAALIQSADGATIALIQATGLTSIAFVGQMKKSLSIIGIHDAKIYNGIGLNNEDMGIFGDANLPNDAENTMSAKDLGRLVLYLLKTYPDMLETTAQKSAPFADVSGHTQLLSTFNKMLPNMPYAMPKITIDGLKTGTTEAAGACFISTGTIGSKRYITIVLHANNGGDNRFIATQRLYQFIQKQA